MGLRRGVLWAVCALLLLAGCGGGAGEAGGAIDYNQYIYSHGWVGYTEDAYIFFNCPQLKFLEPTLSAPLSPSVSGRTATTETRTAPPICRGRADRSLPPEARCTTWAGTRTGTTASTAWTSTPGSGRCPADCPCWTGRGTPSATPTASTAPIWPWS